MAVRRRGCAQLHQRGSPRSPPRGRLPGGSRRGVSPDDARARSVMLPVEPDPIASMPWVKGCARPADMNRRSFVRPWRGKHRWSAAWSRVLANPYPQTRAQQRAATIPDRRVTADPRRLRRTPSSISAGTHPSSAEPGVVGRSQPHWLISALPTEARWSRTPRGPVTSSHSTSAECWHCPVRQMCDEYWRSAFVDRDPGGDRYRSVQHPSGRVGSAGRPFGGWSAFLLGGVR